MLYIICPWHSWIARETPTLEAAGSNPVGQAIRQCGALLVLPSYFVLQKLIKSYKLKE